EYAPDLFQRRGKAARDAGYHAVGIALRDHAGGEDVAVLIGHALAVAMEGALALQALIEELRVMRVALRKPRIRDLDSVRRAEAGRFHRALDSVLAADEDRRSVAGVVEGNRGTDHLFLFALGEHDAPRAVAHALENEIEAGGRRVEARGKLGSVAFQVQDW